MGTFVLEKGHGMNYRIGLLILALFFSSACDGGVFSPTPYDLASGITANPSQVTVHLGQSDDFYITSKKGNLEDVWFDVSLVRVDDPECRCERGFRVGGIEKLRNDYIIYHAPTSVKNVSLPVTVSIYAGTGQRGTVNSNHHTVARITVVE